MKITNDLKKYRKLQTGCLLFVSALLLSGCGASKYAMPFSTEPASSSYRIVNITEESGLAKPFAAELCVCSADKNPGLVSMDTAKGAALFNIKDRDTIYAKNIHEKLYPASLTKIMTALVALKHSSVDITLTASDNVRNLETGAQVCGLKPGDTMTLDQALHILLIYSANDVAVMIAEGISGSEEAFTELMNQEAQLLGATNTHFTNPHGLSDEEHYTSVYDMYLITNAAMQYERFNEIIRMPSYATIYYDKNGSSKELNLNNTNYYLQDRASAPAGITVLGGKTGTTSAAGHCLALISRDAAGNPYISIIMKSDSSDELYAKMTDLLGQIAN